MPNPNLPDTPWQDTWNGVRRALRFLKTPEDIIREYAYWADFDSSWVVPLLTKPTNLVIPFLSALKTKLLRSTDKLPATFPFWIDLSYLAGYPKMEDREMVDDPFLWLSTDVSSQYSASWWQEQFSNTFYESVVNTPAHLMSLEIFTVRRWLWTTDGATSFSKLYLGDEKVKTKFGAALSLSDDELLSLISFDKDRDSIKIFIKPDEAGYKRRLIANVPLGAYIVASYVRYIIESYVGKSPTFLQLEVTPVDAMSVVQLIRERHMAMPLDESGYDYHVSRESWLGFFEFLKVNFPNNSGVIYLEKYFHSVSWVDPMTAEKGRWTSGMPSGLALTSFLNSWMNFIKQREITPGDLGWAAGDDVLTFPYDYKSLPRVEADYAMFGSAVNSMKNWQSWSWAEYLKVLYNEHGSIGYPARVFGSLMWTGSQRTFLPADRLAELAELFKQFFDRLGLRMTKPEIVKYIASDLARAVSQKVEGFGTQEATDWLFAARANGGFGCLPYNNWVFDWKTTIMERKEYREAILRIPPVLVFNTKVELNKHVAPLVHRPYYNGLPLKLDEVDDLAGWERRINREDIPLKGKYATMALDVIPLPTVDLISTSNMSAFASIWNYHVYPNLRGSVIRINDRLISSSLGLVDQVLDWMAVRYLTSLC